ncbi:Pentachlorophenol 4-monooxygenase [Actinomadura rubteroloni]|uniref:Pentachlorophenol 4-monooxygenase n=1 Tax=Actinomadura rubteroloni TaxID=1926885 RepID=A0A2P4UFC2_9ACTN|nr:FAD-dependent monooxygenase [Actinomadura rubteroloni]POM23767.1 Pentachlorophenol 4-monooxygenase [Actinomadura rubteroloni]
MGTDTGADVIVVGAGPVGLLLAGGLRAAGVRAVVLERRTAPMDESRASTLNARTMEVLAELGALSRLGGLPREPRGHFGGLPLDLGAVGGTPYPGQWKIPQTVLEAKLGAWLAELGVPVRRGAAAEALEQDAAGVTVTASDGTAVRGSYVVGCDGVGSTVRALAGIAFPGRAAGRELLRADVRGVDVRDRRFERLPAGLAIAATRDGVTRLMTHAFGTPARDRGGPPDFAEFAATWKRVTGEDVSGGEPLWCDAFGDASRLAERYRAGRVLLAGDAAHEQMPVGGQALNLGLQDAAALVPRLAAAVAGVSGDALLDAYAAGRHAVGARVQRDVEAQTLLLLGGPEVTPVRTVLAELLERPPVREFLAAGVSGVAEGVR